MLEGRNAMNGGGLRACFGSIMANGMQRGLYRGMAHAVRVRVWRVWVRFAA